MLKIFSISLVLILGTLSCASKNFGEPKVMNPRSGSTSKIFTSSYSDVWDKTIECLEQENHSILSRRKDQGILTTDWVSTKSDRLFSGYGDTKIPYKIRYKFEIFIKPSRKGTEVEVKSQEQYLTDSITSGTDFQGSLYKWISTKSSGHKESVFLALLEEKIKLKKGE